MASGSGGRRAWRGRARFGIGDVIVFLVVAALLVWALVPGLGPDLMDLEYRTGWRVGGKAEPAAGSSGTSAPSSPSSKPAVAGEAAIAVGDLPSPSGERWPDYSRKKFGDGWADLDGDGCNTRNEILARDLARPTFLPGTNDCVVKTGTLAGPYTGKTIEFQHGEGTSDLIQIDHVVALRDAWESGAWEWEPSKRLEFANDPLNLLAVDGDANQDKQASNADEWLPAQKSYRCPYVARQIAVKKKYGLSVTNAERAAMTDVLRDCPQEPLPTG